MSKEWRLGAQELSKIEVTANPHNEPVSISGISDSLRCVGIGTDAAVFRHIAVPKYAFKVYANEKIPKIYIEQKVYQQLRESPFFPKFYDAGDNFLVLSYEQGTTLYDCLLQGVHIPKQVIKDVDAARGYISERGLNPRDIHLRNILLQNRRVKIIDLSEFMEQGNDFRWEYLKKGYEKYYHLIDGRPLPFWLLETIKKWYNQADHQSFAIDEFMKKCIKDIFP
jgi:serine/threonine protein kinase